MNYKFPTIAHIDDVLFAIKDSPEFIVAEKDGYKVVNYVVAGHETFPDIGKKFCPGCKRFTEEIIAEGCGSQRCPDDIDVAALRRECRGLVFDMEGNLINRRYHKFFNVNERNETQLNEIDWTKPHVILEKLDGSMVSPCLVNGHLRWMTKMGITDTSMEAEAFVAKRPEYIELSKMILDMGETPIFEWCSNKNRIVLDYPEDRLILTAIRNLSTGRYATLEGMETVAEIWNIPVVKVWTALANENIDILMDMVHQSVDTEGVVVRFEDGHMVKIKADWYVRIHKVKSLLGQERDVVKLILNNELDDLLPVLPKEDVAKIEAFREKILKKLDMYANAMTDSVQHYRIVMDRKTFALKVAPNMVPLWKGMIFKFWDKECTDALTYKAIVDTILLHCGNNQSYAKVKEAFLSGVDYGET